MALTVPAQAAPRETIAHMEGSAATAAEPLPK